MKEFLLRLWRFSVTGIILLGIVSLGHLHLLQQLYEPQHFHVAPDVTILIIGDSHTECSLNPDYMPGVKNISLSAEHYLLTYYKLKRLLDANPHIHTVVVGYSYHNLNQFYDDFLKEEEHSRQWINPYFPLLDAEGQDMVQGTPGYLVSKLKYHYGLPLKLDFALLCKLLSGTLLVEDFSFWGHFREDPLNLLQAKYLKRTLDIHFYREGGIQGLSPLQIYYLFRIAEECEFRRVNLVLLMTPLHKTYRSNIPPGFPEFYRGLADTLTRRYPHTHFKDFSELAVPDNFFRDTDHMNKYGALYFSPLVMKWLETLR